MIDRRRFLMTGAAGLSLAGFTTNAMAQRAATTFVYSGFPVGGLGDLVVRPLIERLAPRWPNPIVYDHKPGAGGRIAAEFVKRAPPDGNTIFTAPSSPITLYAHTFRKLAYDPLNDFVAVAALCTYAFSVTAGPGLPDDIRTIADLVRWAKAQPNGANYGIPASGSVPHFVGLMLQRSTGAPLTSVPYKGGAPLLTDLLGGQVPVGINVVSEVLPHVRSGKLRILAVTSPERWPALPQAPTLVESGIKDVAFVEYLGWFMPAKTPADIVQRTNSAVQEAVQSAEMRDVFIRNALQPLAESAEAFAARVRSDFERWGVLVKATGFTPED